MKLIGFLLIGLFLLIPATSFSADKKWYVAGEVGILFSDDLDLSTVEAKYTDNIPTKEYKHIPDSGEFDRNYDIHSDLLNGIADLNAGVSTRIAIGRKVGWALLDRFEIEYGFGRSTFNFVHGSVQSYQQENQNIIKIHKREREKEKNGKRPRSWFNKQIDSAHHAAFDTDHLNDHNQVLKSFAVSSPYMSLVGGEIKTHALHINIFKDIDLGKNAFFTPWVGFGAGATVTDFSFETATSSRVEETGYEYISHTRHSDEEFKPQRKTYNPGSKFSTKSKTKIDFSYQFMAGLAVDLFENIEGTVSYRLAVVRMESTMNKHSLNMGLRYSF